MIFTELNQAERIRVLKESKDIELLYDLFSKHLNIDTENLRRIYKLVGDFIMNRVYIYGTPTDLYLISTKIMELGITPECCTSAEVRIDLDHLIDKMR